MISAALAGIPWISHHLLDVKHGTYIRKMSWLAMLCSLHSHYADAIKGLCSLYLARGYPRDLIVKWTRDNFTKRWHNRLTVSSTKQEHGDVLVLKSEFNTAWNYFSAKELGDTILGYWRGWLAAAESGSWSNRYPDEREVKDLHETPVDFCLPLGSNGDLTLMPDVRKIGFSDKRILVSRKRTRNLFDLTSLWKHTVLTTLDKDASAQGEVINLHRADSDSDMEVDDPEALFNVVRDRKSVV